MKYLSKNNILLNELNTPHDIPHIDTLLNQPNQNVNYSLQTNSNLIKNWPNSPDSIAPLLSHIPNNCNEQKTTQNIQNNSQYPNLPRLQSILNSNQNETSNFALQTQSQNFQTQQKNLSQPFPISPYQNLSMNTSQIVYPNLSSIPFATVHYEQPQLMFTSNSNLPNQINTGSNVFVTPTQSVLINPALPHYQPKTKPRRKPGIHKKSCQQSSYELHRIKRLVSQIEDFDPQKSPPYVWMISEFGKMITQKEFIKIYGLLQSRLPPQYAPTRDVSRNQKLRLNWMTMIWHIPQCQMILKTIIRNLYRNQNS